MTHGFIIIKAIRDTQRQNGMLYYFLKNSVFLFPKKRAHQIRLGVNIFGKFWFGLLSFRFVEKGFDGSNITLNFIRFLQSNLVGCASFLVY